MSKLIFGCGYLGARVARAWLRAREEVHAVTRHTERAAMLAAEGFWPIVADVTRPETLRDLPEAETVLFAVGYDRATGKTIDEVYAGGLASVLSALPHKTGRIIYISSTGVYGQKNGEGVDEDSPCEPERAGGKACLAAEGILAGHVLGGRSVILRLGGIYGPGRIPLEGLVREGKPIPTSASGIMNLIHVDDAANVVLAAERRAAEHRAAQPRIYCVTDGHPTLRREYYAWLARLLEAPEPTFVEPPRDVAVSARGETSKRVRNARMLAELGVTLAYPSYREGLAAIMAKSSS